MSTDEQILQRLRELDQVTSEPAEGFTCFKQFTIESSGLDPEQAERWIKDNGGYLKHIRISEHIPGREINNPPDNAPCYFVPSSLFDA